MRSINKECVSMRVTFVKAIKVALLVVAMCFSAAGPAGAFHPVNQNGSYEILLPEFDFAGHADYDRDVASRLATRNLETQYGGSWVVHAWNPLSGTPRHLTASGVALRHSVLDATDLELLARQVIADNANVLMADVDQLRLTATPHALGKWVAHFQQTYEGLDVWNAKVRVAISESGKLLLLGSEYFSDIDLNAAPSLASAAATEIARSDLPFDPVTDRVEGEPVLLVLPVPQSAIRVEHHLVWRIRVRTQNPLGAWMTHVDAHSGEIIWRYNDIHFDYGGDTEGEIQRYGWCDGVSNLTIPYLNISVDGAGSTTSDENGDWLVPGSGGLRDVSASLKGPYIWVRWNDAGPTALFEGSALDGIPLTVRFDDSNAQHDERDVFDGINDVHDFFQLFAPEFGYAHEQMEAQVSIDATCNAYWDGAIHFYREGGGCANTGELQQVVHHEFGHGVQHTILGYQGDQGLGEGNSDILGNLITQDPIIGRGFYLGNCVSGIRNSENNLQYPGDVVGQEIHYAGQVIAGFNWDAMLLLQDLYGGGAWDAPGTLASAERWHYGRVLLQPTTQPDQVFATFFADDDNDNMDDGTPHYEIYCEAAENHGFECPLLLIGVLFTHTPLGDTIDEENPYPVFAEIVSTYAPIEPSSVKLVYRIEGGPWVEVTMNHDGGDSYSAEIPAQQAAHVDYYLYAEDTMGTVGTEPADAPAAYHSFLVATFIDPLESEGDWIVNPYGNDSATWKGVWENVDPVGSGAQPEDDHTPDGTHCGITQQHVEGDDDTVDDVDYGNTTLLSPTYDLTGATTASIRYWKWYSNNGPDEWEVWLSNDGGDTFTSVESTPSSTNGWEVMDHDLADHFPAPGHVRLKFIAQDFGAHDIVEAGVDDIAILALVEDLTDAEDGMTVQFATELAQNIPNPFNPRTEIRFNLSEAESVHLAVFDAQGRLLEELVTGTLAAGEHRVIWDGLDADGKAVASGVYLYRLKAGEDVQSKRMLLLK